MYPQRDRIPRRPHGRREFRLSISSYPGPLSNLGHDIDAITIRNILRGYHIDPAPRQRQAGLSQGQFLKLPWEVLAATDFFTVEVAVWQGLVTYYVLFVMQLDTRRMHSAGITPPPTDAP
jgi:putative transposase